MARQKWEQILGALFQGAQSVLPMYFAYMQQQEDEMAQREEEKKAQTEQDRRWQEYLSLFKPGEEEQIPPVITDPKTGAQYSMEDEYVPATPGGSLAEAYPQAYEILSMLGPELFGMPGVAEQAFAPPEEELPPESVNMQEMADVISLLRGDMGVSFLPGGGGALDELQRATGLDYSQEIPAYLANPEMWNLQFPVPEEPEPEGPTPAGLMGGYGVIWNPEKGEYEFQPLPSAEVSTTGGRGGGGRRMQDLSRELVPLEAIPETGEVPTEGETPVWERFTDPRWKTELGEYVWWDNEQNKEVTRAEIAEIMAETNISEWDYDAAETQINQIVDALRNGRTTRENALILITRFLADINSTLKAEEILAEEGL